MRLPCCGHRSDDTFRVNDNRSLNHHLTEVKLHPDSPILLRLSIVATLFVHTSVGPGADGPAGSGLGSNGPVYPRAAALWSFRAMTFNVHHGERTDHKIGLEGIAAVIHQEHADVVAMQEVERGSQRLG